MAALLACTMLLSSCGSVDYSKDLSAYVELGSYKGIDFELTQPEEITDEKINDYVLEAFKSYTTLTEQAEDYAAQNGDTVNMDYVGKINGEKFEGGEATGATVELGSGQLIDGFEEGLVGLKKGDTKTLDLKFPEDYANTELKGKDVTFEVTVNSVSVKEYKYNTTLGADLTDALVAGDSAVISYVITVGEEEVGAGVEAKVTVGEESSKLEKIFADALVGLVANDKSQDVSVTYPADYEDSELAGKTAKFSVTVKSATRPVITAEINDAMIAELTESDTLAAYKTDVAKAELTEKYAEAAKTANFSRIWNEVLKAANVKKYPAKELKDLTNNIYNSVAGEAGNYYGMAMRDFVKIYGYTTTRAFKNEYCKEGAQDIIKEKLVLNAIINAENIVLTEEDKTEGLKTYYETLGLSESYKTYEDFAKAIENGEINTDALYTSLLWEKTAQFLLDNAK